MLSLDFTWTAPDTCPTRAEVAEQLSRAVDSGGKELPPLRARAVVTHEGAAWRLELETELDGRRGTRLLEADSCEGLARAATLVMALTLGEGLARRQAEEEARAASPPPRPPAPAPAPLPPPKPAPPPPAPARSETRGLAAFSLGLGSDPLGELTPTAQLGLAYQPGIVRLAVSFGAGLPQTSDIGTSGVSARAHAFSGGVAACLVPVLPPLRLVACGEAGVTLLRASGRGSELDQSQRVPLYGLGPSLGVEWWLGERALLGVSLTSRFFVKRPELLIEGSPDGRRVEVANAGALLGGGVRW